MAKGRPEFYFDGTYYRKRIKLQNGAWKDIRGKTKEETRAKIQTAREAERLGLALDDNTLLISSPRIYDTQVNARRVGVAAPARFLSKILSLFQYHVNTV